MIVTCQGPHFVLLLCFKSSYLLIVNNSCKLAGSTVIHKPIVIRASGHINKLISCLYVCLSCLSPVLMHLEYTDGISV